MRTVALSVMFALVMAGQKPVRPAVAARQAEKAAKQAERQAQIKAQREATRPVPKPGELAVDKLSAMTPAQRERALAALPPERRARIEKNLEDFQKLPPVQQERARQRLEMLNSLPPRQQVVVRQSMREFNQLPPEQKQAINRELRVMAPMSDEERRAHMNTEEFRNRFALGDRETIGNLSSILPRPSGN